LVKSHTGNLGAGTGKKFRTGAYYFTSRNGT